jgi:hypothetical protein
MKMVEEKMIRLIHRIRFKSCRPSPMQVSPITFQAG